MGVFLSTVRNNLPLLLTKKGQETDITSKSSSSEDVALGDSSEAFLSLNVLKENLATASSVSQERVDRLVSVIQAGHYDINPQRMAEKMLEHELFLP